MKYDNPKDFCNKALFEVWWTDEQKNYYRKGVTAYHNYLKRNGIIK